MGATHRRVLTHSLASLSHCAAEDARELAATVPVEQAPVADLAAPVDQAEGAVSAALCAAPQVSRSVAGLALGAMGAFDADAALAAVCVLGTLASALPVVGPLAAHQRTVSIFGILRWGV